MTCLILVSAILVNQGERYVQWTTQECFICLRKKNRDFFFFLELHESSLDHTLVFHIHSSRESLYFQSVLDSLQRELWYFSLPVMSYSIIRYRILLKDSKMRQVWSMVLILFLEGSEWGAGKWERGVSFLFEWCLCFFFTKIPSTNPQIDKPCPKLLKWRRVGWTYPKTLQWVHNLMGSQY